MRKLILFNMMTVDGFFEGENHAIDWHNVDEEFNLFAKEQLNSVDILLFGRITYELMANYWPAPAALDDDTKIANQMNSISKIVFSRTMERAGWNNTRLIRDNIEEEIRKLKQLPGKDLIIFGSANLVLTFRQLHLIDEYRIMINPVILGKGKPLFKGTYQQLRLMKTRTFQSGNVLLYYEPKPDQ